MQKDMNRNLAQTTGTRKQKRFGSGGAANALPWRRRRAMYRWKDGHSPGTRARGS